MTMSKHKPRVILVTGMPGSGKNEFVKISQKTGIRILRMGDFVRSEAEAQGIDMTDENVGSLAQRMRDGHGFNIWAKRTIEEIDDRLTVIDGVRGRAEMVLYRQQFGNDAVVVAIHSSPAIRFKRLVARRRADAPKSMEEFEERDLRELSWGLGDVISRADYLIVNESTLQQLTRRVEAVIDEILGNR